MLVETQSAAWLRDGKYPARLTALLRTARRRVLAQQFLVDARPAEDKDGQVRYLLHALAEAAHRGVDVRVLIAQVLAERPQAVDLNEPAARFLLARGVSVRRVTRAAAGQLHAKLVVVDDVLIAGGHNWTPAAMDGRNCEASVQTTSAALAHEAATSFERLWARAEDYPPWT